MAGANGRAGSLCMVGLCAEYAFCRHLLGRCCVSPTECGLWGM